MLGSSSTPTRSAPTALDVSFVLHGYEEGASFSRPRGIAFDPSDGAICVANTGNHRLDFFSRTGRPLCRFVHRVTGRDGGTVDGTPVAVAFDRSGRLLVIDLMASYIDVLDRRGRSVKRMEVPGGQPAAIAVSKDGTIFVGTAGAESKVHRFRRDYAPDGVWGEQGPEPGQLLLITAIAELSDSTIAVGCLRTKLGIQVFTPQGGYLRGFGTRELGRGGISRPSGLAGTPDGLIWVVDEIRQSILVFDREGKFISEFGGRGAAPGEFAFPSSLASDGGRLLAVTDGELGRAQVLGIR
jgi:DNA-binding beta-propeller fold protein YncE